MTSRHGSTRPWRRSTSGRRWDALWSLVDAGNKLIETSRPWELAGSPLFDEVLSQVLGLAREAATELGPFLPDGSARLLAQLTGTEPPAPVFQRLASKPV